MVKVSQAKIRMVSASCLTQVALSPCAQNARSARDLHKCACGETGLRQKSHGLSIRCALHRPVKTGVFCQLLVSATGRNDRHDLVMRTGLF
jgi:hypothetical protein